MDWQLIFNLCGGAALTVIGWFANTIYTAVEALKRDLSEHKIESAKTYITKAYFEKLEQKIDDGFNRIYDRIDKKVDRP